MTNMPSISDSELEVMKIIWENPGITANNITQKLENKADWKQTTIKTLINRLLNKKVIKFNKIGKEYYYYPLIDENDYIAKESKSFLKKMFNGSINSMVLNYVKNTNLTEKELEELRNILNGKHE